MRRLGVTPNWVPLPVGKLPRLLVIEFTLGVLVFGVTGFLTSLPPPRGAEFTIAPEDIHPLLGQRIDGLFFKLQVTPNRPGRNLVSLHIAHDQVAEVEDVPQVKVKIGKESEDAAYRPVRAARDALSIKQRKLATAGPVESMFWQSVMARGCCGTFYLMVARRATPGGRLVKTSARHT